MMTNKELNVAIKKELKEAGYNVKDFSVSVKDCGYSTSIRVTVKSPYVNRKEVESILKHYEEYEVDGRTYEILEGGNTYLFIEYAYGIFDEVAQKWAATARGLMDSQEETTRIFNGLYLINLEHSGKLEIRQHNEKERATFRCTTFRELCIFLYKFATFGTIAA